MNKLSFKNTKIKIKGVNFSNLLEEFKKNNITIKQVKKDSPCEICFFVPKKHLKKVIAILNQRCYTILEQKDNSFLSFFKSIFFKPAIIIGIIFGVLLNFCATFFVWGIKLYGDNQLKPQIINVLKQNNIKMLTLKTNLTSQKIENILRLAIPELSLVNVSFKGSFVLINYTKRTEVLSEANQTKNIIAKNDGIVASVLTTSGTALIKPNEYVKKGQVLIAGYTEENGEKKECSASGQVFAYVWKSATIKFYETKTELLRTGNFVENYEVKYKDDVLFKTNNVANYEMFENECYTKHLTESVVPIVINYTKTYELRKEEVTKNFEDYKKNLFSQAKMLAWEQIKGDENILEEKTEINYVSNIYFITHYIKIKEKIS